MKILVTAVFVMLVATASPVMAAITSNSNTYGPTGVAFSGLTVPLLKFDASLGPLTKVTLTLDASTDSGSIAWDNEASIGSDVTLGIGAQVTATAPLSLITVVAVPLQSGSSTVDEDNEANDGDADFIGTDAFAVIGGSGSDSDNDFTTSSLSTFIATVPGETFDTIVGSVISTYLSSTGGFGPIDTVPGLTYGTITVTYEYIPEPATMGLLAIGGLAVLKRKRSR